jgi:enterochelin esterase-like enzyme
LGSQPVLAQEQARINELTIHSPALEGNWEGTGAERTALVYTPPGYNENPDRRYPVVYFLHGYGATKQMYQDLVHFEEVLGIAAAEGNDFILVMPDGQSRMLGSFYSNSPTTGDFESYIARDLVAEVDANFRTLASRESRGLAGHSMGGYGTMRLGLKFPEVFSSIYAMSACCFQVRPYSIEDAQAAAALTAEAVEEAEFGTLGAAPFLAAWSPDPAAPHKFATGLLEDGSIDPGVMARIAANSIIPMLPQYLPSLRAMDGIALDVGDQDGLKADNDALHAELDRFGIAHTYEVYEGGHGDKITARIRSHVLPFFAQHLEMESPTP